MIITVVLLSVDLLVLLINDIPFLHLHTLYLIFLTLRLAWRSQPDYFELSLSTAEDIGRERNIRYEMKECKICHKAKPPRYYHCRHCQKCVYRLDHHCNFIGNCVGFYNFKVYTHFLIHGFLHSIVLTLIILWKIPLMITFEGAPTLFWLALLPALFGIYQNIRLLLSFKTTIQRNQTLIESYKKVRGPKRTTMECFKDYFGIKPIDWVIPSFVTLTRCDRLENTFPIKEGEEIKDYQYADEYIYGSDSDQEWREETLD